MEVAQLELLAEAMKRLGLTKLRWRDGDQELEMERGALSRAPTEGLEQALHTLLLARGEQSSPEGHSQPAAPALLPAITSPLVGTFYSRPSPSRPAFVQEGDRLTPDTIVAIVEAMKVMNEIRAGVYGIVAKVECQDGDPVEFGTPLLRYTADVPCAKS